MTTKKRLLLTVVLILFVASMIAFLDFDTDNAIKIIVIFMIMNWWHESIKKIWDGE